MAAWLPQPVMFDSSHSFDCEGFTPEQCSYYKQPWHNWYVADWSFALPTVALFMSIIGLFVIGYGLRYVVSWSDKTEPLLWRRGIATTRYLSYRGFHIRRLRWNSAPVGVLLLGASGTLYFFCMELIPSPYYWPGTDTVWGNSPPLGTRSGWLALACMPFLFATASKTNWITLVTGVTHEKLQVFHRWIAYAFFVTSLMHTFPFIVWHIRNHDMVNQFTVSNIFEYWTGIVALLFQAWLTVMSCGPIRNLGYEFFKAAHFIAATAFVVIFFWHCGGTLTSWHYFVATAAVYVPCLTYSWLRTFFEYGLNQKATLFVEENGFTRISIPVSFTWQPGQHCFLRFRGFGTLPALSSHPFTICSLPVDSQHQISELSFYIRHRSGFTAKLHEYARTKPGVPLPVLVDGPYGGIDNHQYFRCDRIVVIGGGSGAGWMLPLIEQFLRFSKLKRSHPTKTETASNHQTFKGPKSLRIILATRDVATRTWFTMTVSELVQKHGFSGNSARLDVEVHLTGEAEDISNVKTTSTSVSSEEAVTERRDKLEARVLPQEEVGGRPDLPSIIEKEGTAAASTRQTVGVYVCGPLTMQNDVRNAVAGENLQISKGSKTGGMYLHLEHFSWA